LPTIAHIEKSLACDGHSIMRDRLTVCPGVSWFRRENKLNKSIREHFPHTNQYCTGSTSTASTTTS
jgi:hypothetical protein